MIIRSGQLLDVSIGIFAERISGRLRSRFQRELSIQPGLESNLRQTVAQWIKEAMGFTVVNQPDVELYAECKVIFGSAFPSGEDYRWALAILENDFLDGETKMDKIDEYMLFGLEEPV